MPDDMAMQLLPQDGRPETKKEEKQRKKKERYAAPNDTDYQPVNWRKFYSKKYIPLWILLVLILIASVLITVYQEKVVDHLRPFSEKVRKLPAGWLIPIAILFVLSFPPLFGNEIVEILCGVIYGLWIGFGVVAAGTFLGEIGNWFLFKYALRKKAAKLERTNLNYGAMARMARDGSFWIILLIRLSAIPPHFSTAVFSTCNVKFWAFLLSTFLSLPKQIFLVYLGVLLVEDKKDNTAQTVVLVIVLVLTIIMAAWIWRRMKVIKAVLLEEQEQRRRAKMGMGGGRDEEESVGAQNELNHVRIDGDAAMQYSSSPYDSGVPPHSHSVPYEQITPYMPYYQAPAYAPVGPYHGGR